MNGNFGKYGLQLKSLLWLEVSSGYVNAGLCQSKYLVLEGVYWFCEGEAWNDGFLNKNEGCSSNLMLENALNDDLGYSRIPKS
jgi:hypothetical protein